MTLREQYEAVFRSLSRVELQAGSGDFDLPDLFGGSLDRRFLGFYTEEGLRRGLERYGLFDELAAAGYPDATMEMRCDDPEEHMLRFWAGRRDEEPIIELVARRDTLRPSGELLSRMNRAYVGVLNVEWLQLQRPGDAFTPERPPLPGQSYPGLGLGREILELLRQAARRLQLEALVTVPSYFHNAYFYSVEFQYVDPREQGLFLALCRDVLPGCYGSVAAASWAIAEQMVVEESNADALFSWFHDVMLAPISDELTQYMQAPAYHAEVQTALREHGFRVLEGALARHLAARGIRPLDVEKIRAWIDD